MISFAMFLSYYFIISQISASAPAAKIPHYGSDVSTSQNSATQQLSRLAKFNESDSEVSPCIAFEGGADLSLEGESPSSQPTPPPKRGRFVENTEAAASV